MEFMKKFLQRIPNLTLPVISWLLILGATLIFTTQSVPDIQFPYYNTDLAPHYTQATSVLAHFDGIHYLRIARYGYQDIGAQAFFPLYPLLIRFFTPIFPSPLFAAVAISIISLIIALIGLRRLFPTHKLSVISHLLLFPTSFFFLTSYTESLFLALSVWFFVLLKREKWLSAALLAGLASSTRLVGSLLALSLIIKYLQKGKNRFLLIPLTIISLSGLTLYSYYLNQQFSDPLMFVHVQSMFGMGRSTDSLILLPQVIYRYLKMFLTVPILSTLSARIYFEFASFSLAFYLAIRYWSTRSLSLNFYLILSLILPTLTGTLSSIPRYILVLIPFLIPLHYLRKFQIRYATLSIPLLIYFFYQFARGYFVA